MFSSANVDRFLPQSTSLPGTSGPGSIASGGGPSGPVAGLTAPSAGGMPGFPGGGQISMGIAPSGGFPGRAAVGGSPAGLPSNAGASGSGFPVSVQGIQAQTSNLFPSGFGQAMGQQNTAVG